MIPIVTLDKEGKVVGQQAFNDNLTPVEEINRVMLATYYLTQLNLTNDNAEVRMTINKGEFDDAKLKAILDAAMTMQKAVADAIDAFKAVVVAE